MYHDKKTMALIYYNENHCGVSVIFTQTPGRKELLDLPLCILGTDVTCGSPPIQYYKDWD